MISLSTSATSILRALFITEGAIVTIPWNKKVPIRTFFMDALLIDAPPIRIAATV
jgi:hypothetical protein